jgi:hypothetical protein
MKQRKASLPILFLSLVIVMLGCTDQEAQQVLAFHNSGQQAGILIPRPE